MSPHQPNDYLQSLNSDAVISYNTSPQVYKLKKILETLDSIFHAPNFWNQQPFSTIVDSKLVSRDIRGGQEIFEDGIECEILDTNFKEWKKGKLRAKLVLEFIPDQTEITEPESPLDEIYREIQASQLS
ncbi:MAG: KGK domain-containing protein [Snowella sp.]|nr:KGK domain-containing protein [Snowella sp.]